MRSAANDQPPASSAATNADSIADGNATSRPTFRTTFAGSLPARSAATTSAARAPENGLFWPGKNQYAMPGSANRVSPGSGA